MAGGTQARIEIQASWEARESGFPIRSCRCCSVAALDFHSARLREILHLQWTEIDFERGLLFLGDSKTGKKSIVLNAPALAILQGLPNRGPFVIPGEKPDAPRADLKGLWQAVTARADLHGVDVRSDFIEN